MTLAPFAFERGETMYLVSPVVPFQPEQKDIEEFAFADTVLKHAPNPNIVWMKGQYVEADRPNLNGAMWLSDELAVKSLTPNFMPVTVMHDPRTAVGLIADTRLVLPDEKADNGPKRARLDNTIGLWGHRFPEAVEEALANYEAGSLMQSMECRPGYYDCSECGTRFAKLPGGAEEANWCAHLKGVQGEQAARILGGVCFTGTGLIFGSRGAQGAYTEASLEPLMDEVAEFHERAHDHKRQTPKTPKTRSKRNMEIEDSRYQELLAAESRLKEIEPKLAESEAAAAKVPGLESQVERLETEKVAAESERDEEKAKREGLEEQARAETLRNERVSKLGQDFLAKLGETTKGKLDEQAKSMSDEDWTARLEELAELTGVAHDAGTKVDPADKDTFTTEEVARAGGSGLGGGNNGGGSEPSAEKRRSVVAGLAKVAGGA